MDYEVVIGLEVHTQLLTRSKMFCGDSADYDGAPPNTHVCPVCLGMPGVLPVINAQAVEYTVMTGLALNCQIPEFAKFDRKNYPYPDLMKGYQISQYDLPFCINGWLEIEMDGEPRRIGIRRVHLEEDTAKLVHVGDYSLVDVNRAGVPLMEIVSEPDIRSAEEARLYLIKLRQILRWMGVSTGDMEAGALRCDANISVRPRGATELGVKTEVKNMNSFRAVKLALEYEAHRQVDLLSRGGKILQETRGWVESTGRTVGQRSKEFAHDYRYFPEPDLTPVVHTRERVAEIRSKLPELPDERHRCFVAAYGLSAYDADLLTAERPISDYFETAVKATPPGVESKAIANWVAGELFRQMKAREVEIDEVKISPAQIGALQALVQSGVISISVAKTVFEEMFATGKDAATIVRERGLTQISDATQLGDVVDQVIAGNPQAVADYRSGKETALRFLVGQVMKATKGQANPGLATEILQVKLK